MSSSSSADCIVVGAGPAGMVLGLLLVRRGVRVRVLETHADFERDFRGDTIHPSTLAPLPLRVLLKVPVLRDIPARMIAFGPRPCRLERADEHPPAGG